MLGQFTTGYTGYSHSWKESFLQITKFLVVCAIVYFVCRIIIWAIKTLKKP